MGQLDGRGGRLSHRQRFIQPITPEHARGCPITRLLHPKNQTLCDKMLPWLKRMSDFFNLRMRFDLCAEDLVFARSIITAHHVMSYKRVECSFQRIVFVLAMQHLCALKETDSDLVFFLPFSEKHQHFIQCDKKKKKSAVLGLGCGTVPSESD